MKSLPSLAFDIVGMAASAGGLRALSVVLAGLPRNFPVPIVVLQHLIPQQPSLLVMILSRRILLPVKLAEEGEWPEAGVVYVAPPDRHLTVNTECSFALTQTAPVHFVRPAADVLFKSLAVSYDAHVIAVVLSGTGFDGQAGVQAVKKAGGFVIAQDKDSADFFGMPEAAIGTGCVDRVLPLSAIPGALVNLVMAGTDAGTTK